MRGTSIAIFLTVFVLVSSQSRVRSETIFADNFDAEVGSGQGVSGGSGIAYTGFTNWAVSSGSVDLIAYGDYGISCANSTGKCVDLDGASSDAGILATEPILLGPGVYQFSFELAGVDSAFVGGEAATPNVVNVTIGSLFVDQITRNQGDAFQVYSSQFSVMTATMVQIIFANQGGDNFGALLDNVQLVSIPEPSNIILLAIGLLVLTRARGRRVSRS